MTRVHGIVAGAVLVVTTAPTSARAQADGDGDKSACDKGNSPACDRYADFLQWYAGELLQSPDGAKIDALRDRACKTEKPGQDPPCRLHTVPLGDRKPVWLAVGLITGFGNAPWRGTFGGELTLVRWFDKRSFTALGGYGQLESVDGGGGRGSVGVQVSSSAFGIEAGYAYQSRLRDATSVHGLQIAPFFSLGIVSIGLRVVMPVVSSGPLPVPFAMGVLGFKVPVKVSGTFNLSLFGD